MIYIYNAGPLFTEADIKQRKYEGAKFVEAPKEVRKILEDAGYVVRYQRCADDWSWGYAPTYHGRYVIGWK